MHEVTETARKIYDLTDYGVNLIRPPQGIMSAQFLSMAEELGYRIVLWDIDTRDWAHEPVDKMVKNILTNADNGDIILFHDYHTSVANTIQALDIIIPALQSQGYRFVTVTELLDN